jgi:hypothetical protein
MTETEIRRERTRLGVPHPRAINRVSKKTLPARDPEVDQEQARPGLVWPPRTGTASTSPSPTPTALAANRLRRTNIRERMTQPTPGEVVFRK